jgi:exosortase family protein XrtF
MILFVSFVVAFTGRWKQTLLFILFGLLLIHLLNISRIALLSVALCHYPEQEQLLHAVIFPFIIYGVVFLLWVIWVNKFSLHANKTPSK